MQLTSQPHRCMLTAYIAKCTGRGVGRAAVTVRVQHDGNVT